MSELTHNLTKSFKIICKKWFLGMSCNDDDENELMMNCFCGMVDRWKAFSLISKSPTRCQQCLNLHRTCAESEFKLSWMRLCSSKAKELLRLWLLLWKRNQIQIQTIKHEMIYRRREKIISSLRFLRGSDASQSAFRTYLRQSFLLK